MLQQNENAFKHLTYLSKHGFNSVINMSRIAIKRHFYFNATHKIVTGQCPKVRRLHRQNAWHLLNLCFEKSKKRSYSACVQRNINILKNKLLFYRHRVEVCQVFLVDAASECHPNLVIVESRLKKEISRILLIKMAFSNKIFKIFKQKSVKIENLSEL